MLDVIPRVSFEEMVTRTYLWIAYSCVLSKLYDGTERAAPVLLLDPLIFNDLAFVRI